MRVNDKPSSAARHPVPQRKQLAVELFSWTERVMSFADDLNRLLGWLSENLPPDCRFEMGADYGEAFADVFDELGNSITDQFDGDMLTHIVENVNHARDFHGLDPVDFEVGS